VRVYFVRCMNCACRRMFFAREFRLCEIVLILLLSILAIECIRCLCFVDVDVGLGCEFCCIVLYRNIIIFRSTTVFSISFVSAQTSDINRCARCFPFVTYSFMLK